MMNFNPEDFYKLGKKLYDDNNYINLDEARRRTCISRTYYSVYLKLREELLKSIPSPYLPKIAKSGLMHSCLSAILKKIDIAYGDKFRRVQMLRKNADYETGITISDNEVEDALAIGDEILNRISWLLAKLIAKRNEIEDIIEKYYRRLENKYRKKI